MTTHTTCPGCAKDETDLIPVTIHHYDGGAEVIMRTVRVCRACADDGETAGRLLFPARRCTPEKKAAQHARRWAEQAIRSLHCADDTQEAHEAVEIALCYAFDTPHRDAAARGVADEWLDILIRGLAAPQETHTNHDKTAHVAYNAASDAVTAVYTADNPDDARAMLASHLVTAFNAGCVHLAADIVAKELVWNIAKGLAADGEFIGSAPGEFVSELDALIGLRRHRQRQRTEQSNDNDSIPF